MDNLNKCRKKFIEKAFVLFLSIKGEINFLQLERYGNLDEQTFRNQFEVSFDFMALNKEMGLREGSGNYTIAFDPSYITKAGKSTPGVGYFWSGSAGKAKWGLEIGGIAVVDIDNHSAFHLEAVQTFKTKEDESFIIYYARILVERKEILQGISKHIVADAYFSKEPFLSTLTNNGFELCSRLRDDADLQYIFTGLQKKGRGRPKKYGGKVDYEALNLEVFTKTSECENTKTYSAIVYSKSFKRNINVVVMYTKRKTKWVHKIYFSTDLNLPANTLLEYYQTRFQIEFLYRDGKQHTGLDDCQARSENKMNFHFNTSLTTINLAKITHWLCIPKENRPPFSMANIKTLYNNTLQMKRFLSMFAINPNTHLNKQKVSQLLNHGRIAA